MPRFNKHTNPALKNNTTGWFVDRGTRSIALAGMSRTTGWAMLGNAYAVAPRAACAPGQIWTTSFEILQSGTGSATIEINLEWRTSADSFISTVKLTPSVPAGVASRVSVTGTAPANAALVTCVPSTYAANRAADLTSFMLEQAGSSLAYFDGDSSGATWDGTVGNSSSTLADPPVLTAPSFFMSYS